MHSNLLWTFGFLCAAACLSTPAWAQKDSLKIPVRIDGYVEAYYVYDFARPDGHNRPDFLYSFDRHNEVNLNIGMLRASFSGPKIRANLGLMAGTYSNANLAAEPGVLKNLYEANVGVKLSKTRNLWLDVGVFASHIGFEGAIGADCWTMTRSIVAENSPYYLSGAKVTYLDPSQKWLLSGLVLNGWQRIQRPAGSQLPAFGHQVQWRPNDRILLNSSSFVGSDTPDSARLMRYYHDFFVQLKGGEHWGLVAGFDVGAQQTSPGNPDCHWWFAPVAILRYAPSDQLAFAARAEYFDDRGGVIVQTGTPNGFRTFGSSLNVDFRVAERFLWRCEARWFNNRPDGIFLDRKQRPTTDNWAIGTSLSVAF